MGSIPTGDELSISDYRNLIVSRRNFSCQNWCICNAQLLYIYIYIFDLKMLTDEMSMRMQWFSFVIVPILRDTDSTLIYNGYGWLLQEQPFSSEKFMHLPCTVGVYFIVRRAGLLWSQQDFEWRWSVPLFKCLTVLEFSFILFDLCLLITFFNFIMNYVPIVTFWIFTYHKIWILSIMFCFIWSYWIIYFLACLEVSWRVVS